MFKPIFELEDYGVIDESGVIITHAGETRSTYVDPRGETSLTIKDKRYRVKNLIAQTFLRQYDSVVEEVVYIDGNKNNLHKDNLEIRAKQKRYKLTQDAVLEIVRLRKSGYTMQDLINKFGVSRQRIYIIMKHYSH